MKTPSISLSNPYNTSLYNPYIAPFKEFRLWLICSPTQHRAASIEACVEEERVRLASSLHALDFGNRKGV